MQMVRYRIDYMSFTYAVRTDISMHMQQLQHANTSMSYSSMILIRVFGACAAGLGLSGAESFCHLSFMRSSGPCTGHFPTEPEHLLLNPKPLAGASSLS